MTFRPRFLVPLLALSVAFSAALLTAPSMARADTLSWATTYTGPDNLPNGERSRSR